MKLKLTGKKTALLQILLDEGVPPQFDGDPKKTRRTTAVKITVKKGKESVGTVEGIAFCHPADEFSSFVGRRQAMRKAFDQATKKLLSKKDRRAIAEKVVAEVF